MNDKSQNATDFKTMLVSIKYFYKIIWKNFKSYIVYNAFSAIFAALAPIYMIFLPKLLIDEFQGDRDFAKMAVITAVFVVLYILTNAADSFCTQQYQKVVDKFNRYFGEQHKQKCASMDFEKTEDPEILDLSQKAQNGLNWYGGVDGFMRRISNIISGMIQVVTTAAILLTGSVWVLLIVVAYIAISFFLTKKRSKLEFDLNGTFDILDRKSSYNFWQTYDFKYGKDIRLYDASKMLDENCRQINDDCYKLELKYRKKIMGVLSVLSVAGALKNVGMYLILGIMAIKKLITIGNFSLYSSSALTVSDSLNTIVSEFGWLTVTSNYLYNYVRFMGINTDTAFGNEKVNMNSDHEIEFKDVWFKYPRSEKYILKGVNIKLKNGEKLSIVGLNGTGKTTFIKLLCRLYKVDKGEILIDGKNINEYDFDEYSKLFSVVFQDYKLFAFSFKENISVSEEPDEERVLELCRKVGLSGKINDMPNGMDTIMFKQFDESGVEPSGGEQQKMSIARALYKDAPIVILDEPTAALDPIAEYEIYRQFNEIVNGKTAIYISHRLSSCKFCDKIAVFKDGVIKEYGHHSELLEIPNGEYKRMFDAQAKYYINTDAV